VTATTSADFLAAAGARPGAVYFGGGLPDPATFPADRLAALLGDVLHRDAGAALTYDVSPGHIGLRASIAADLAMVGGSTIDATWVMLTHGTAGAITLAAASLLEPGDVVVAERLSYPGSLKAFRLRGAEVVTVPVDDQGVRLDALEVTLQALRRAGRRVKLLYTIPTCHNPTGSILPRDRRDAIVAMAEREDLVILQDDTYGQIRFEPVDAPSFLTLAPERAIHLGSFSKTIAPGLRLGWAAAPPHLVRRLADVRTDLGTSPLVQRAVHEFVHRGEYARHLATVTDHYRAKRDVLLRALDEHATGRAEWNEPRGGFFVWVRPHRGAIRALVEIANEEGVVFLPAEYFGGSDAIDDGFRLAYGELPTADIVEGARRLGRALARHGDGEA
jgi:2-aminoadipate transaminase